MDYEEEYCGTQAYNYEEPICTQPVEISTSENSKIKIGELHIKDCVYDIFKGTNKIGRNPKSDIHLKNLTVSSEHAEIEASSRKSVFLYDTNSSNGTMLNDTLLKKNRSYQLLDNNVIKFGEVMATYKSFKNEESNESRRTQPMKIGKEKSLINTSSPNKTMSGTLINDLDLSCIPCSQPMIKTANHLDETEDIVEETRIDTTNEVSRTQRIDETETYNISKSNENSIVEESSNDMFEDTCELNSEKRNLEKTNMKTHLTKFKKIVTTPGNSTPIKDNHKFTIPETPIRLNDSRTSTNNSALAATESINKSPQSVHDQTTLLNTLNEKSLDVSEEDIYDQETQVLDKVQDSSKVDIYDAEAQHIGADKIPVDSTSVYNAPTQCLSHSNIEQNDSTDSETDEEGVFDSHNSKEKSKVGVINEDSSKKLLQKSQILNDSKNVTSSTNTAEDDIYDAETQKIDQINAAKGKPNETEESDDSNDSICLLETQNAKEFLAQNNLEGLNESIFDAPTQTITPPSKLVQDSDSDTDKEGDFVSKNSETNINDSIYDAPTQTFEDTNCPNSKNNEIIVQDENSNSNESIDFLDTQSAKEFFDKNTPVGEPSIFDVPTQILPSPSEPLKTINEESDSETDEEGIFDTQNLKKKTEEDIHDAVTQKIVREDPKHSTEETNLTISDVPTQKITFPKTIVDESDSETDEEGVFESENIEKEPTADVQDVADNKSKEQNLQNGSHNLSKSFADENDSSNESVNFLQTEAAADFFGTEPANMIDDIYDAPTQRLDQNVEQKTDNLDNSDDMPTQKMEPSTAIETVVKTEENADIFDEETQKINYCPNQPADVSANELDNNEDIFDIPTQKLESKSEDVFSTPKQSTGRSTSVKTSKLSDTVKNIYEADTEKIQKVISVVSKKKDLEARIDQFDKDTPRDDSDSLYDAPTQKIDRTKQRHTLDAEIHDMPTQKLNPVSDEEDDIFDAPTQVIPKKINFSTNNIDDDNAEVNQSKKKDETVKEDLVTLKDENLNIHDALTQVLNKDSHTNLECENKDSEVSQDCIILSPSTSQKDGPEDVIFLNSSDSESDFSGFKIIIDASNTKLQQNKNSVDDDSDISAIQKIDRSDSSSSIDDELDLPATQPMSRQDSFSSGIECSKSETLVEDNLRHIVGDSQTEDVGDSGVLMTQQLIDVLQSTQPEQKDEMQNSPLVSSKRRLMKSMSLKKKTVNQNVESNLQNILGDPEVTDIENVSSQMMTQQIVSVLENSQSEEKLSSVTVNLGKRINLSTSLDDGKDSLLEDNPADSVSSTHSKRPKVEKTSKDKTSPVKKRGRKRKTEVANESVTKAKQARKVDTEVSVRGRRKRNIAEVSKEPEMNDSDSQNRQNRAMLKRKKLNEPVKSEISASSSKVNEKEGEDSQNYYASLKSKRKTNVLTDSRENSPTTMFQTETFTKPKTRAGPKTRSKVQDEDSPKMNVSKVSTRTRAAKAVENQSSGTLKLSLSKKNNVWKSVRTQDLEEDEIQETQNKSRKSKSKQENLLEKSEILKPVSTRPRGRRAAAKKQSVEDEQEESPATANQSTRSVRSRSKRNNADDSDLKSFNANQFKVMFTGIEAEQWKSSLKKLGISEATDINNCSVLLTDKIRRTVKFICALAMGIPILNVNWIKDSANAGHCIEDFDKYILKDSKTEKDYEMSLKESLQKAKKKKLFKDYSILLTPKISVPSLADLKKMIQCSGGTPLTVAPRKWPKNTVIVSSIDDLENAKKFAAKAPKNVTVQSTEFILSGILCQEIDLESFVLDL